MNNIEPTKSGKYLQWVLCFFVTCFFFKADLKAQTYPDLVPAAVAQVILDYEIPFLESNLENLTEGTPAYQLAMRTYVMYTHAWEGVTSGVNLADVLTSTYGEFAIDVNGNDLDEDELPSLSKTGPDYGDPAFDDLVTALMQ